MDKKQYVLTILEKLSQEWDIALWLHRIVSQYPISDTTLEALLLMFASAAKSVSNVATQKKLQTSLEIIQKIKQKEMDEKIQNDAELESMLQDI